MPTKLNNTPLEATDQANLVQYLELQQMRGKDIMFSAIPNSTYSKSWSVKRRNKQQGVRAGLPDLFLIINQKPLFIEMKREKGGSLSLEQKVWINKIQNAGIDTFVCRGFEEAKNTVDKFLHD